MLAMDRLNCPYGGEKNQWTLHDRAAEAVSPAIPKALHPSAYYPAVSPVVMVQGCFSDGPGKMK